MISTKNIKNYAIFDSLIFYKHILYINKVYKMGDKLKV